MSCQVGLALCHADQASSKDVLYTASGIPGSFLGAWLVGTSLGGIQTLAISTLATSLGTLVFVLVSSGTGVMLSSMFVSLAATLMCELDCFREGHVADANLSESYRRRLVCRDSANLSYSHTRDSHGYRQRSVSGRGSRRSDHHRAPPLHRRLGTALPLLHVLLRHGRLCSIPPSINQSSAVAQFHSPVPLSSIYSSLLRMQMIVNHLAIVI